MKKQNILAGIILLVFASFCFSIMGVLIRSVSETANNASIVFFRNLYSFFILLPLIFNSGWFNTLRKPKILGLHCIRSVTGLAAMYCFFFAIAEMKLSKAMIFPYSAALFIPLIGWLWLKEKTAPVIYAYIALGFIGVLLIVRPNADVMNWIALLGLLSSFLTAIAMVSIRLLGRTESAKHIALNFTIISTLVSFPIYLLNYQQQSLTNHLMLFAIGVLAAMAQLTMSRAYSIANAGSIAAIPYTAILFAGVWAYIIWNELPSASDIIGMSLIISATLLTIFTHHISKKRSQAEAAILD